MARTKKKTVVKVGGLELSRRVPVAERDYAKKPAPKKVGTAIGVSGNGPGWLGFSDNGDYLKKLQGPSGRAIYDEMRRSDGQVKTILQAIGLPLRQATYYVDPAADDPGSREIAESVEEDFLRSMTMTWDDTLRHILLMLPFGFSVLEKVWEYRDDRIRPRKLDPRLPQSILRWHWQESGRKLIGPMQSDESGHEILLPIEKLLVFTLEREGDNWEGISLLRPLYKAWYIKNNLEKINAIKHDRYGVGVPKAHLPDGVTEGSEQWNQAVEMLEDLQAQEQSYVLEPSGWEVGMIGGGEKAGTDALPSIKYYDESMARTALTMFVMLGQTETGSRALGQSFTDLFLLSLQTYADYICEVMNRFAIREYIDYNWSTKEYPLLKARRIQRLDPATLQLLVQAGLITKDDTLEDSLREELNLPDRQEEEQEEEPDEESENAQEAHTHTYQRREPNEIEREICDVFAIDARLDVDTERVLNELIELRQAQIDRIISLVAGGQSVQNITVPAKKEMYELLIKAYKAQHKEGRREVTEEIARQRSDIKASYADYPDQSELLRIIEEELRINVEGAADKLKTLIAELGLNLRKQGLGGDELLAALNSEVREQLSDVTWRRLSGLAVNQGWGDGRKIAMDQHADEIEEVYRSAILDGKQCEVCERKDQRRHELNDPEYKTPDPMCKGGPGQCRCVNVAIMKSESEVTV